MNDKWIPEIYYEEDKEGVTNGLPFVKVPKDKSMPSALFMCEIRDIKEEKVDQEVDLTVHMYANMSVLKNRLDKETFDKVRTIGLNLQTLKSAEKNGDKISLSVKNNLSEL